MPDFDPQCLDCGGPRGCLNSKCPSAGDPVGILLAATFAKFERERDAALDALQAFPLGATPEQVAEWHSTHALPALKAAGRIHQPKETTNDPGTAD